MLTSRQVQDKSAAIRNTIKAIVAQLDSWTSDQRDLETRRRTASASFPRGLTDRRDTAQHRARTAIGTHNLQDPPCELCGSTLHLSDECDLLEREPAEQVTSQTTALIREDPATSIHRAIVHRLYLEACTLYKLVYPCFYSNQATTGESPASPDYLALAISQAVDDFRVIPGFCPIDIRNQRPGCCLIAQLYYSKAFSITFSEFCCRIADCLKEQHSE
jgi:hypothetical protein